MACGESILKTIRRMIGPSEDYTYFDSELIMNINAAFSRLCQLGVGPETPFHIRDENATWEEFMDGGYQEEIKQYIFLKVKLVFDPPASSTVISVYKEQIDMLEWTLKEVAQFGY